MLCTIVLGHAAEESNMVRSSDLRYGRCVFKCPDRAAQGVPEVVYACEVRDLDSATAYLPLQVRISLARW